MKKHNNISLTILVVLFSFLVYSCQTDETTLIDSWPSLSLSQNSIVCSKEDSTVIINIISNRTCSVGEIDCDWITAKIEENNLLINIQSNDTEVSRTIKIVVSTLNSSVNKEVIITQAESGIHTLHEDLYINSDESINTFIASYNNLEGNLIISPSITKSTNIWNEIINKKEIYFQSGPSVTSLTKLTDDLYGITGNIFVIGNDDLVSIISLAKYGSKKLVLVANALLINDALIDFKDNVEELVVAGASAGLDLSQIGKYTKLRKLNISNSHQEDISYLAACINIEELILGGSQKGFILKDNNQIHDLTSLLSLTKLTKLDITSLPIEKKWYSKINETFPGLDFLIDSEDERISFEPIIDNITYDKVNDNLIDYNISYTLKDKGFSDIKNHGILLREEGSNTVKTILADENSDSKDYNFKLRNLKYSTIYNVSIFATNANCSTIIQEKKIYTGGFAILESPIISVNKSNEVTFNYVINLMGDNSGDYGVIWDESSDVTLDNVKEENIIKTEFTLFDNEILPLQVLFNKVFTEEGLYYYVRSFVKTPQGITYSDPIKFNTYGESLIERFVYKVTPSIPDMENSGIKDDITNLSRYFYLGNVSSSGEIQTVEKSTEDNYPFFLLEGNQDIIITNAEITSDRYSISTLSTKDEYFKLMTLGTEGFSGDILISTINDATINANTNANINLERINSKLKFHIIGKIGTSEIRDLSEYFTNIKLTTENSYAGYYIDSVLVGKYITDIDDEGNIIPHNVETSFVVESTDKIESEHFINILPTISGNKCKIKLEITLLDGTSINLYTFADTLKANNAYTINLVLSINESDFSFTIDSDIEDLDDTIIEF
ncbi:MAG: BACON domain-containing protein [Bacteroidales bacterium]